MSALALTEMSSWGIVYYTFSVMLAPMQHELGYARATLSGAFSLALLLSGLAAIPIGRVLDRYGARAVMTAGSCAATLLVFAWSQVQTLTAFYLVWAALGIAMAAVLYEPAFVVVATWFERRRHHALTLLTFGGGLASVLYVPFATYLVEHYGWRSALQALSVVLGVSTIPLHALLLRRHPRDLGLHVDGRTQAAPSEVGSTTSPTAPSVRAAVTARAFWWLAVAFASSTFAAVVVAVHLIAYLTERGYSPSFAATTVSVVGAAQIPGRLLFTPLAERLPRHALAAALLLFQTVGLLVLLAEAGTIGVLLFALLFGAGAGALTPARAALVADKYGATYYGSISGTLALVLTFARASAPISAGMLYTVAQSYTPLLWTMAVLTAAGAGALLAGSGQLLVASSADSDISDGPLWR